MMQEIHLPTNFGEIIGLYGLSITEGTYHIYFLYKTDAGHKKWGHYSTRDFLQFKFLSGEANIIAGKTENIHYFANTDGQSLIMELVKTPEKSRNAFLSLPRRAVIKDAEILKYPPENLFELREYKRKVNLQKGESTDTFGSVFEAKLVFSEECYRIKLRDDIFIEGGQGFLKITYEGLCQVAEPEDTATVHIFSDKMSVEIFVGGKVISLPTEHNENGTLTILEGQCRAEIYKLKSIKVS